MAIQLSGVVPFGRSLSEYRGMFSLTPQDLTGRILGVGDGPASFNAEATGQGAQVISVDPIYAFSGAEIQQRFDAVVDDIMAQVVATPQDWVWNHHRSPADLRHNRIKALETFLADYEPGKMAQRYRVGQLPTLDFPDQTFELALCSHFLFLYSAHYDAAFHWASIRDLLRVSQEVRIFPLLTLMGKRSPHLDPILDQLQSERYCVEQIEVGYELQKGGNQMLRIHALDPV